jgi:PleD family two-component response regulator
MSATSEERTRPLILVVDDDVHIARFIEMSLRMEGFDTVMAHDGPAAIDAVLERQPDLLILDLMLPLLDGVEVTTRLRDDAITSALPIIMLTAKAKTTEIVLGLEAGADHYIVKPFDTLELIARVRTTLRRNQDVREASPLTSLPGNIRILREVADRLRAGEDFAVCYCDIDGQGGQRRVRLPARDEFIVTLAPAAAACSVGRTASVLGHVGGDDFVVVCTPIDPEPDRPGDHRFRGRGRPALRRGGPRARLRERDQPPRRGQGLRAGHRLRRGRPVQPAPVLRSARADRRRQ